MRLPDGANQIVFCESITERDLFCGLTALQHKNLVAIESPLQIMPYETVFRSGDQAAHIYIHRKGRAAIVQNGETGDAFPVVAGQVYGIIEALSESTFHSSLRTITKCEFAIISRDDFLRLILGGHVLSFRVATIMGRLHHRVIREINTH